MNLRPMRTEAPGKLTGLDAVDRAWDTLYAQANERLKQRMEERGCPTPAWAPAQDIAVVYRFPNDYQGNVIIPEAYADSHDSQYSHGLLLFAGPEATDVLESHGILPGDVIKFARFAGEEEAASRVAEVGAARRRDGYSMESAQAAALEARDAALAKKKLLELQVPFIHGSVDLLERLYGPRPTMEIVRQVSKNGEVIHLIRPVVENL